MVWTRSALTAMLAGLLLASAAAQTTTPPFSPDVDAALSKALGVGASAPASAPSASQPAVPMPEGVDVVVASLEETRNKNLLAEEGRTGRMFMPSHVRIIVHVTGQPAAAAQRFGKMELTSATDSKGNDLLRAETLLTRKHRNELVTIDEWKRQGVKNGFAVEVDLNSPAREASSVSVQGSLVMLSGGKPVEAVIKDVAAQTGKEVDHPVLKEAGMTLKIVDSKGGMAGSGKAVSFTLGGTEEALLEVELIDGAGKPIPSSSFTSQTGNEPKLYTLRPTGTLPEGAALRVKLLSNAKALKVPLNLKDVPLP